MIAASANGISYTGDYLAITALLLAIQAAGDRGTGVAWLWIATSLPIAVLAPIAGRLVDRVDSRALLVSVGAAQTLCCLCLAFTTSAGIRIGLVALLAAGLAVTSTTFAALVPAMAGREHLGRAVAVTQTATSAGALAGPALAGILYSVGGPRLSLLIDTGSYLAITLAGLAISTRRNARQASVDRGGGPAGTTAVVAGSQPAYSHGWRLVDDRLLVPVFALFGLALCAVSAINVAEVFFVRGRLHAPAGAFGAVAAVWMAALLVGAWLVPRWSRSDAVLARALVVAVGLESVAILVAGSVPTVGWYAVLCCLGGLGNGALGSAIVVLIGRRTPAAALGRAHSIRIGVANVASLFGFSVGGALVDRIPAGQVISGCGAVGLLVAGVLAAPVLLAVRRTPVGTSGPAGQPVTVTPQ